MRYKGELVYNNEEDMKFNEKLKSLRETKHLTQEDVAEQLSISRQSVSKWEQGINEPDIETLKRLCIILNCSIEELVDDDKEIASKRVDGDKKRAKPLFGASLSLSIFAALAIPAFLAYAQDEIIVHWAGDGSTTLGPKWMMLVLLLLPFISVVMTLFYNLILCKKPAFRGYRTHLGIFALVLSGLLSALSIVLCFLMSAAHNKGEPSFTNLLVAIVPALLLSVAPFSHPYFNEMNLLLGFRSSFTFSSETAWKKVNTVSATVLTLSALPAYVLILAFIDRPWAASFLASIILGIIVTALYHLVEAKNSPR